MSVYPTRKVDVTLRGDKVHNKLYGCEQPRDVEKVAPVSLVHGGSSNVAEKRKKVHVSENELWMVGRSGDTRGRTGR